MKLIRQIFRPYPKVLYLEPVFGCNFRCFSCIHGGGRYIRPVLLDPALFEKLKPLIERVKHIHITGLGEPLLNGHLTEYLAYLRERNKSYYINTNGSLITEDLVDLLTTSRSELSVSLDAGDGPTYRQVRAGGDWKSIIAGLKHVSQIKASRKSTYPLRYLTFHINALNLVSMAKVPQLVRELGIDAVKFSWTILPDAYRAQSIFKKQEMATDIIRQVVAQLRRDGIQVSNGAVFDTHLRDCWNFSEMTFIGANGSVAACCSRWLAIGHLNDNSFQDIWNGMPRRSLALDIINGRPHGNCQDCTQILGADYVRNRASFLKPRGLEEKILLEKTRWIGKLPCLRGLDTAFSSGVAAFLNGDLHIAADIFGNLDIKFPEFFEIKNNLAVTHANLGNFEQCREVLQELTKIPHIEKIFQQSWSEFQSIPFQEAVETTKRKIL
jgi:MoaA/NifB/PqqE/SkfB family radical SAM enzyme